MRIRIARINSFLQENITGMKIIQSFIREEKNYNKFQALNKDTLDSYLQTIFYYALFYPVVEIISSLAIALVLLYGGFSVLNDVLTLGVLIAFITYAQRFYKPIMDLSEKYSILQSAMTASERIFKLLDTTLIIPEPEFPQKIEKMKGDIEFRNIWFAYNDDYILKDISFSVKQGQNLAIVGATGAGKTTIINLLSRFYEPNKGSIFIDSINIKDFNKKSLRKNIGVVLQDVFLFSGKIEYNISLGDKNINFDKIRKAAKEVDIEKFITKLPKGYSEDIKERGSILSFGQRQLLAFARALAYDPRILVLDEATSNIDTETELLIQNAMKKLMKRRTSIVIAHRLSTIQNADKIIVIHKGRIREEGTHQELLAEKGIYYKLYLLQYKEQEKIYDL